MQGRPIINQRSSTTDIYEDLKARLVTGGLPPGGKLKPTVLQAGYGCSSNTLRDVLMRLCALGLVEFQMQRGFRATPSSPERRRDVARFRLLLEREGVLESMGQGGIAWEAELAAAHHKLLHIERRIADEADFRDFMPLWTEAEREFHETLISASHSPLLIETFSQIYLQFRQQFVGQQRDFGTSYFEAIIVEHQAIVDAALARDPEACRNAIHEHLKRNLE
ncbi:MAG: GntR family transcriptional regulator [Geminicoccaceae bacterium]